MLNKWSISFYGCVLTSYIVQEIIVLFIKPAIEKGRSLSLFKHIKEVPLWNDLTLLQTIDKNRQYLNA